MLTTVRDAESTNKWKLHKTDDWIRCMSTKQQQMLEEFVVWNAGNKKKLARLLSALRSAFALQFNTISPNNFFFSFSPPMFMRQPHPIMVRKKQRMTLIIMGGEAFSVLSARLTDAVIHVAIGRWVHAKTLEHRLRCSSLRVVWLSYG